jgi:hypothetical protein
MRRGLGNGLDVDVPMGMRPMSVNRNVGVKLAGVIQIGRPIKRVNNYIIFDSLSLHTTGNRIAKPSLACANPVQLASPGPTTDISAGPTKYFVMRLPV